ncbi:RdgB/HAM1 family non-canonical purine NTP pyrophosphatase [Candidatus Parcubacteria bacterium]|nr:RdgB/HAM1 family non-canonical purine NTP pyrophosphatase [Candidatus Parcubacteria bacterium]
MNKRKMLIGTRSKGKFPEIIALLQGLPFEFVNLNDVAEIPKDYQAPETGETFEENALMKAKDYAEKSGLLTAAEDSGLEVDALNGAPGVMSARWAPGSDLDRTTRILEELEGVHESKRGACFRAVVALYDPKTKKSFTTTGVCTGKISTEFRGTNGFAYDPIFFVPQLGKTFGEMSFEEKNSVSFRNIAWRRLGQILEQEFLS